MRVLILNAGKATRLDGKDKLHVLAGGARVHEWHRRAYADHEVALVTGSDREAPAWIPRVLRHDALDGPVGAIAAYLDAYDDDDDLLVAYADTLIPKQDYGEHDWVGVSQLLDRTWDYQDAYGQWIKDYAPTRVAVGLYRFTDLDLLRACVDQLGSSDDQHLPPLLNRYSQQRYLPPRTIVGWHDAGDWSALARVPNIRSL